MLCHVFWSQVEYKIICLFIWLACCNQCLANKTDHLEWEGFDVGLTILNGKSLGLDYNILVGLLKYRFWISDKHFLTKPNYDIFTSIKNDNIWNWLKSCSEYYTIWDSRSNCIWPEYFGQCLADKTDHLEWEGFDAGLTILNGKSLGFDYYILVGLLKISILHIRHKHFLTKLNYDICIAIENYSICNWMKSSTDDPCTISDYKSHLSGYNAVITILPSISVDWEVFYTGLTILNGKFLGFDYNIINFEYQTQTFSSKALCTVTENDSIWNWLKSCSKSYIISNSESNCIWPEYRNQCLADKSGKFLMRGWPSRMESHWRLITIFWLAHWIVDFEYQTISHTNIFSRRLMFYIPTATGNYSLWNRLKSFTYPDAFSDFKSHFLWPEYCNKCLADNKTDHLEREVFNVGLTILNGKLVALDYYIPIGLL